MQPAGKPKRKPPRKACNRCPACLAPPCKECSNCTNSNSNKRCKQRLCPYLALPSSTTPPSSAPPAPSTQPGPSSSGQPGPSSAPQPGPSSSPQAGTTPSSQPGSSLTAAILSVLPQSAAAALLDSPSASSPGELSGGGPAQKRNSSLQQDDEESGGRKRQRLQEDHLKVEAMFNNYVLVKKNPKGLVGLVYQCLKCNTDFPTRIICIRHAFGCGKTFTGKRRGKNTRQITCNICPFKTTTEGELAKHRRDEHQEVTCQRVRCLTCNETFATVKSLKKHIMNVHKNSDVRKCGVCGKDFASQFNLKRHMDTHLRDEGQRERDRLAFREVGLDHWQWGDMTAGGDGDGGDGEAGGRQEEEVDHEDAGGSDVEDDPALPRQGFSVKQLADAYIEQCRQNGDSASVLMERRRLLEERLLKKVTPCVSTSSPGSTEPSTSSPAATAPPTSSSAPTEPPGTSTQVQPTSTGDISQSLDTSAHESTSGGVVELSLQPGVKYVISTPVLPLSSTGKPSSTASAGQAPDQLKRSICDVCDFKARDNYNLVRHKKSMHTVRGPAKPCPRSWCRLPLSTAYEWQQHVRSCVWQCSDCTRGPLKYQSAIDEHIAWHISQRAKLSALETEV